MDKRQIAVAVILGLVIYAFFDNWIPELLAQSKQAMCDEGSLAPELCVPNGDRE